MPLIPGSGNNTIRHNIVEMMRAGHPQQVAVAAALSNARRFPSAAFGGGIGHFDDGGSVTSTPGLQPSASTMNPFVQSQISRYSNMSPEQLQEFVLRAGNSQAGKVASNVLNQKRIMTANQPTQNPIQQTPSTQQLSSSSPTAQQTSSTQQQQTQPQVQGYAAGGFAVGGSPLGMSSSAADPFWTRQEVRQTGQTDQGFLNSSVAGRTDHIAATPATDSYVIPADVVSGVGEGNSLAGARILDLAFNSNPYGIKGSPQHHGPGPPHVSPPRVPQQEARGGGIGGGFSFGSPIAHMPPTVRPPTTLRLPSALPHTGMHFMHSRGGARSSTVPIMAAGGEYIVHPDIVTALGRGDVRRGHRMLDKWVVAQRKRIVSEMRALPGPVKQ